MKIPDLLFFITEAFIGIKRSLLMALISIATITVSLIIFGIFLLITINFNNLIDFVVSKLEIRVYFKDSASIADILEVHEKLKTLKEVKSVVFIDKQKAWDQFSKQFSNIEMKDLLDENPLPNTLKITVHQTDDITTLKKYFKENNFTIIEDISFGEATAERITMVANFAKYSGLILVGLLTIATLLIIVNTIRLMVLARQNEIEIMQLVGATNNFIKGPFLIEGLFFGITGSIFAIIFIKISYMLFVQNFQANIPYFPLVFDQKVLYILYAVIISTGASLGILGAYLSISRSLKSK